jgi:hypothetical protein
MAPRQSDSDDAKEQPMLKNDRKAWNFEDWRLAGAICVGCMIYSCAMAVADPDLWGHTLYGLRALDQGVLTETHDPFSYTAPGADWINHEWLTEYQFGWLWTNAGGIGLLLWRNAMVACVFAVGLWSLSRARANLGACLLLLIFSTECLSAFTIFIRPQLATFALLALSLAILRRHWDRPTPWVWALPVIMAAWVNLHGGFLAGLGLQFVFAIAAILRAIGSAGTRRSAAILFAVASTSLLATMVNPYGIEMHGMLWQHLAPAQAIREWQPLWSAWQSPLYYVPFVLLALMFGASRSWDWIDALVCAVVAQQAVSHIRHVALLAIVLLVLGGGPISDALARMFRRISQQFSGSSGRKRRRIAVAAALIVLGGLRAPSVMRLWREGVTPWAIAVRCSESAPGVPRRAITFMRREGVQGNLLTAYSWGQYMLWHLHPDCKIAFDGRYRTIYPSDLEADFLALWRLSETSSGSLAMLDDYPTEIALLPASSPTCDYVRGRADWVQLFADGQSTLLVKRIPKFEPVIRRAEQGLIIIPPQDRWTIFPAAPPDLTTKRQQLFTAVNTTKRE